MSQAKHPCDQVPEGSKCPEAPNARRLKGKMTGVVEDGGPRYLFGLVCWLVHEDKFHHDVGSAYSAESSHLRVRVWKRVTGSQVCWKGLTLYQHEKTQQTCTTIHSIRIFTISLIHLESGTPIISQEHSATGPASQPQTPTPGRPPDTSRSHHHFSFSSPLSQPLETLI